MAGVQLKPGVAPSEELTAQIVRQTAGLPEHERPARVIFVGDMPTVLGGAKVQRQALRERLQAQQEPGKPG